ncbi:MAG: FAD-dependent monooxygenase [Rhodospirillaceae bacterium]|nr:FAD-dependent monooxygenase [Rhodospirillaceae bacterium]MYH39246.1 FAD-dependent monooxygenase [Rhodospirillaceae bacterium]MYK16120.1 FAD-dependent monooxygenase [Rhodospirillaceae bacterium]
MAETDRVIVAGAGPVGMTAAAYLALHDIPVLVLEAGDDLATDLRASTWHPPTLDLLDFFDGIVAELAGWGLVAPTWQYRDRETGPVVTWDLGLLKNDTGHPYRIQAEQWKLTRLLHRRMADVPHFDLRFGHEVTGAGQDGDRAWVTASTAEGLEKFEGRWVVGGDGANSAVRRSLGVAYDGLTFPELFLTLSTGFEFRGPMPDLTLVNYFADPEEWLVLLRVVDAWRVLFPTGPDEDMEVALTDERVQERLDGVAPGCGPFDVVHKTYYRVHQRVADTYRIGRILLAGDAAHINNPLGGMGMNGGIQDAFSLCEKLVSVWRGEAEETVLDRYERQRRKMALDFVQQSTVRNRETLMETDPVLREKRHDEMRRTAGDPAKAREFLLRSSMIAGLREAEAIP